MTDKSKTKIETNKVKKEHCLIRQYNTQNFDKYIFLKYRTRQIKATETNKKVTYQAATSIKISPILEKDNFIEHLCIILSFLIK